MANRYGGRMIGVDVIFRGAQATVTRYEPLGSGMCDTLVRFASGREVWVSSHELRRVDGEPIPARSAVRREADANARRNVPRW